MEKKPTTSTSVPLTNLISVLCRLGSAVLIGFLMSCRTDAPTEPAVVIASMKVTPGAALNIAARKPGDSVAVDSLARGFAGALADPFIREKIHSDLRDSPFPQHRIHLQSYLSGVDGAGLLAAIARASGLSIGRLHTILAIRGGLQVMLPSAIDRMNWSADKDIYVEGTASTIDERREAESHFPAASNLSSAFVFSPAQTRLPHSLLSESKYSWLSITPIEKSFGDNPELQRLKATHYSRPHISTFEEEIALYKARGDSMVRVSGDSGIKTVSSPFSNLEECDPSGCGGYMPPPAGRPMGVSLPSGKTYSQCYQPGGFGTDVDGDQDGVDDGCEAELAIAFRPQLVTDWNDCETRRQPHFAAKQKYSNDWGGVIVIFYAVSYIYDCGPNGHRGDTEWIILEVGPSTNSNYGPWSLKYGTLSAHWGTSIDNTAGYAAQDLEDAEGSPGFGAPRIWVAKGKHANYRTQTSCNSSGFWWNWDSCDSPMPYYFTLSFGSGQNLGNSSHQFVGGANSPVYDAINYSGLYEYYWVQGPFCGWIASGIECADTYEKSLVPYGF